MAFLGCELLDSKLSQTALFEINYLPVPVGHGSTARIGVDRRRLQIMPMPYDSIFFPAMDLEAHHLGPVTPIRIRVRDTMVAVLKTPKDFHLRTVWGKAFMEARIGLYGCLLTLECVVNRFARNSWINA